MHLDLASALNLVSTVTLIGALVFTGLQVRGAILSFWSRAKDWAMERRKRTGHDEFLEWCEWLATQIMQYRATRPYVAAYLRATANK